MSWKKRMAPPLRKMVTENGPVLVLNCLCFMCSWQCSYSGMYGKSKAEQGGRLDKLSPV